MSAELRALRNVLSRSEADEENLFVRRAREAGFLCRKLNGESYRGWPDQLVLGKGPGAEWFIEFKKPGKYKDPHDGLTANQTEIIAKLRALDKKVLVTDSAIVALKFIGAIK